MAKAGKRGGEGGKGEYNGIQESQFSREEFQRRVIHGMDGLNILNVYFKVTKI